MTTEALLSEVVSELRAMRKEIRSLKANSDACDAAEVCELLSITNRDVLTYWARQGVLTRVRRGRDYIYYRNEIITLANQIRVGKVLIPTQAQMRNHD